MLSLSGLSILSVHASPITVIAAENFYGELVREIGGDQVKVQSIISNPDADPHLFTTSPALNRSLSKAQIIIYNGAGYDSWMEQMLATNSRNNQVSLIKVADLVGVKDGENPHLWYKPETFPKLANLIATKLIQLNPQSKTTITNNLNNFLAEHAKVIQLIAQTKAKYQGTPVTATEPVYGYMAQALGLTMLGNDFQWKIMNDTEPTPQIIASYQNLLTHKKVKILFYNNQVTEPVTKNMQELAKQQKIQVVGVSETMPNQLTVNHWLRNEIQATTKALAVTNQ
jgi:zinc/manganese transport system substrate-binding protein